MKTDDELVLGAIEREIKRLSGIAEKAKADLAEREGALHEIVEQNKEVQRLQQQRLEPQKLISKIEAMQKRRVQLDKVMKKDYLKMLDKLQDAEMDRDSLINCAQNLKWRIGLRNNKA